MQRITTATHELLIFTDGGQTHIYRWPLGQSPLPLAGKSLSEIRDYLDYWDNQ